MLGLRGERINREGQIRTVIVEPDFLDHWKTRMLVELTKDEAAPLMLLRLWGLCQSRKDWRFRDLNGQTLAAICRSKLDGNLLLNVLRECGFIETNGQVTVVHDWDVSNARLVSAWKNGLKGGRPRKPMGSLGFKHRKPKTNPSEPIHLSSLSYLSVLSTERVRERFKEWIPFRQAQGKAPKNWDAMFTEQCKWLRQFSEADQLEILSASIRNNWQGLFEPKQKKQERPTAQSDLDRKLERDPLWREIEAQRKAKA